MAMFPERFEATAGEPRRLERRERKEDMFCIDD